MNYKTLFLHHGPNKNWTRYRELRRFISSHSFFFFLWDVRMSLYNIHHRIAHHFKFNELFDFFSSLSSSSSCNSFLSGRFCDFGLSNNELTATLAWLRSRIVLTDLRLSDCIGKVGNVFDVERPWILV